MKLPHLAIATLSVLVVSAAALPEFARSESTTGTSITATGELQANLFKFKKFKKFKHYHHA